MGIVEKLIQIRGYNINFGSRDDRGTLIDSEIQEILSLHAPSPRIDIGSNVLDSNYPKGGTQAELVIQTQFMSKVKAGPPNRVIRFVRAAQFNWSINEGTHTHTCPGYVSYDKTSSPSKKVPEKKDVHSSLSKSIAMAKWAFDGPGSEFEAGQLKNLDKPGTKYSDLPYGIQAHFLIILYDEEKKEILEVGRKGGLLCVWREPRRSIEVKIF